LDLETQDNNLLFISWSGELSRRIACELYRWIPGVIGAKPWMSEMDIEKGSRWHLELVSKLEGATFGIICLTPDNLEKPWILFEAGALSKSLKNYAWTFLFHVSKSDITGPLAQFQHTTLEKEDVRKLMHTINSVLPQGESIPKKPLDNAFNSAWPELELNLNNIAIPVNSEVVSKRSDREILEEILELVRTQSRFSYEEKSNLQMMIEASKAIDGEWGDEINKLNEEVRNLMIASKK
jgi:hypothetical protein